MTRENKQFILNNFHALLISFLILLSIEGILTVQELQPTSFPTQYFTNRAATATIK